MKLFLSIMTGLVIWGCLITRIEAKCSENFTRAVIINSSPYSLRVETKKVKGCKTRLVTTVLPKNKKYLCVPNKNLLSIATLNEQEEVIAWSATDLFNSVIITTPEKKIPYVQFSRLREGDSVLGPKKGEKINWENFNPTEAK